MLLHAEPGSHSQAPTYCGSGLYEISPTLSERMRISRRHYGTGLTDNQRGIPHVSHHAGCAARHGFTDYNRKSFTARGSSGYVHRRKESSHILTYTQQMTTVSYAFGLGPLHQLRVLPSNLKSAEQEVNVWHLFVQSPSGANEIQMILQGMETGRDSN